MALGTLGLELYANSSRLEGDMGRAAQIVESRARAMDAAAAKAARSIEGVGKAAGSITRVNGIREAANDMQHLEHTTVGARREMLVLAHEILTGNYKRAAGSVMVLGERMDWMTKIMSPAGMAIGLVSAAVIGLAAVFIKGALEAEKFNKSIVMTGNYAGLTAGRFTALAKSVAADSDVTEGHAREMAQAMVSTGRFSGEALQKATVAAAEFGKMTGKTADEVAKDFVKMAEDPVKWAVENNKQYHYVDGAIYDHMKALQDQGDKEGALMANVEALHRHMRENTVADLGWIQRAWKAVGDEIQWEINATLNIGRPETVEDQIAPIRAKLADIRANQRPNQGAVRNALDARVITQQNAELGRLVAAQRNQQDNAELTAARKHTEEIVVEDKVEWAKRMAARHEGQTAMDREIAESIRIGKNVGAPQSEIDADVARIRKSYQHGGGGGGLAHADMEAQLKPLQDQIAAEDKLLKFRETVLDKYYRNNLISIRGYYDTQRTVIEANLARITALYDQEIRVVENAAAHAKDAATRTTLTTKANDLRAQKEAAITEAQERLSLSTEQQTLDTSAYNDEVEKLVANLNKLRGMSSESAGAEFDRTHKKLIDQATAAHDVGTLDTVAQDRAAVVAQEAMNNLKVRAQEIEIALADTEKRIGLQTQTGQETELQGLIDIGNARQDAIAQLNVINQQMQQIASDSGFPKLTTEADQFKLKLDELAATSNAVGKKFNDIFASSFATFLDNAITGTKSLKQNFLDMATSIEQAIARIVATDLANKLFGIGNNSSGGGSDGSGLIGKLIGIGLSAWASGGAAGSENLGASSTSTPDDLISGYGRASGGPVIGGGMYQVNENGPELLSVANKTYLMMGNNTGRVTPMGDSAALSPRNNFTMNIAVPPGTTRASAQQQASEIMRHAQIAMARNA